MQTIFVVTFNTATDMVRSEDLVDFTRGRNVGELEDRSVGDVMNEFGIAKIVGGRLWKKFMKQEQLLEGIILINLL